MKRIAYFLTMVLALPLFVACSNDTEEELLLPQETPSAVKGTETREADERPYYWYDGHKEYLSYVENSSFVLFYEKDRESVFSSLTELGVDCSTILEGDYSEKTNFIIEKGGAYDYPDGCRWMRVDIPCQTLKEKLTDAIYISPLVTNVWGGSQFAISNEIMVSFGGSISALEEITKDYKVEIMGRTDLFNIYFIWCTKGSVGNALEIANKIYESGKVSWTEPCFHGLGASLAG
ncbi:MAG: hypothetical protein IKN48_03680 [Bacteroidaceae bacterium]|nr:hypothetical protein [Bacteroidaceae bacterium]